MTLVNECELLPCISTKLYLPCNSASHKDVPCMLPLDVDMLEGCNCTRISITPTAVIVGAVSELQSATGNLSLKEGKEGKEDKSTCRDEESSRIKFPIKGSTYKEHCQKNLKECQFLLSKKNHVCITFKAEPDNVVDCNAIIILSNAKVIGYVPGEQIKRMKIALEEHSIVSVKLSVTRGPLELSNTQIYKGELIVVNKLSFVPADKKYYYGKPL